MAEDNTVYGQHVEPLDKADVFSLLRNGLLNLPNSPVESAVIEHDWLFHVGDELIMTFKNGRKFVIKASCLEDVE